MRENTHDDGPDAESGAHGAEASDVARTAGALLLMARGLDVIREAIDGLEGVADAALSALPRDVQDAASAYAAEMLCDDAPTRRPASVTLGGITLESDGGEFVLRASPKSS